MEDLKTYRDRIDAVDAQMLDLFGQRMRLVLDVARYKEANNLPVRNAKREREILSRVDEMSDPDWAGDAKILYQNIFSLCRAYEHRHISGGSALSALVRDAVEQTPRLFPEKARVACQGVEGAYSQHACDRIFRYPDIVYASSWGKVLRLVSDGAADYGILPIENSTAGSVNKVYDLLREHHCYIVRSIRVHVEHSLLVKNGTKLEEIREIISHEQAIAQSSEFLSTLDGVTVRAVRNTAEAAKLVAESDSPDIAALASPDCAEIYGLTELVPAVQNVRNNYTRFICVAKTLQIYPGADRTSFLLTAAHRPGALYAILSRLNAHGINMRKLESRPIPEKDFEFCFYFDVEASVYSDDLYALFDELEAENCNLVYFGSYSEVL